jgi:hypothetical protein
VPPRFYVSLMLQRARQASGACFPEGKCKYNVSTFPLTHVVFVAFRIQFLKGEATTDYSPLLARRLPGSIPSDISVTGAGRSGDGVRFFPST